MKFFTLFGLNLYQGTGYPIRPVRDLNTSLLWSSHGSRSHCHLTPSERFYGLEFGPWCKRTLYTKNYSLELAGFTGENHNRADISFVDRCRSYIFGACVSSPPPGQSDPFVLHRRTRRGRPDLRPIHEGHGNHGC